MSVSSKDMLNVEEQSQYLWEAKRFATFKNWIFSDDKVCNAHKMAEAGFIFAGNKYEKDAAKCFLCDKALDGWDEEDDPWLEHLKHSKNCKFAQLQLPEDAMTLQQFLKIKEELTIVLIKRVFQTKKDELNTAFNSLADTLKERYNT